MASEPVRAGADWLTLREPADAAARAPELVDELRRLLPTRGVLEVHDLGSGTGSMMRWLAPRLGGPQRWVLHDRDADLLSRVADAPAAASADGAPVTVETRLDDITQLDAETVGGAHLLTASALLDMMTAPELDRFLDGCASPGCPVLIALSVVGQVELTPPDPLDHDVMEAFNAHQRRTLDGRTLLGPDAASAAVEGLRRRGFDVSTRPSPWRLGPDRSDLAVEWLIGWVAAATEQRPDLGDVGGPYARRRLEQAATGSLSVTVHHEDLLARP